MHSKVSDVNCTQYSVQPCGVSFYSVVLLTAGLPTFLGCSISKQDIDEINHRALRMGSLPNIQTSIDLYMCLFGGNAKTHTFYTGFAD